MKCPQQLKRKEVLPLMGKIVTVNKIVKRTLDSERNVILIEKPYSPARAGWVTGRKLFQLGQVVIGTAYDPSYLDVKGTARYLKVVFWPNENPVFVPADGYIEGEGSPCSISKFITEKGKGQKEHAQFIKEMRKVANEMPRNSTGQFIST